MPYGFADLCLERVLTGYLVCTTIAACIGGE